MTEERVQTAIQSAARPAAVFLRRELSGPVLVGARAVLVAYGCLALFVYLAWLPGWIHDQATLAVALGGSSGNWLGYTSVTFAALGFTVLSALSWITLAALVFVRRSRDLLGIVLSVGFLSFGIVVGTFANEGGIIERGLAHPWAPPWPAAVILVASALSLPWAYVFPDGRVVPRWTLLLAATWLAVWLVPAFGGPLFDRTALGSTALTVVIVGIVVSTGFSLIYRYWRQSSAVQRQQLRWVLVGAVVFVVLYLFVVPTGALVLEERPSGQAFLFQNLHLALFSLAVIAVPVALGIAIFRQGLLDIDLILNRTVTYGALTVMLALSFFAISAFSNWALAAVTGERSQLVALAAVVPVALAFMPARARALKIADRFVAEDRVTTLLFLDIVGSTDRAYALGDRHWRELLERFRSAVRRCLKRYGGKEIETSGDGFFVTFDSPGRALRCAHELTAAVRPLDIEIRVGLHIGQVQVDGTHVEGANVHLAARVMATAGAGEVVVSGAFRDVVAGSDIEFADRGSHVLKGVPGAVQLYSAFT